VLNNQRSARPLVLPCACRNGARSILRLLCIIEHMGWEVALDVSLCTVLRCLRCNSWDSELTGNALAALRRPASSASPRPPTASTTTTTVPHPTLGRRRSRCSRDPGALASPPLVASRCEGLAPAHRGGGGGL